ncbi:MAG TPA: ABC transporter substrate-binding protein [Spirochaetota bacterium]|nr:ABC transporter substrate-binding protein [Spirochaetota bacterium]HOS40066.1 ABC transporter substrate-binding protein [Spirochaetota bacterium]
MNRFYSFIIAMAFASFLILPGCAKKAVDERRGVTDTTVKIGQWGPQSGPAALWGAVARGSDLYFKIINEEGGIAGRKIQHFIRDDGYQPNRTKSEVKQLVEGEGVFAFVGGLGTATGMAVKQYLNDNKVPWVNPSSPSSHWTFPQSKYLFNFFPLSSTEADLLLKYAMENLKKNSFSIFYQNDDYGKLGYLAAKHILEKKGLKLAEGVSVENADTDLSSHALKLKNANADVVIMWVNPKHASIILGQCANIGYKPQWMASSTLSDMAIMYKISRGLWKDMIFANFTESPDSDSPLMKKYRAYHQKFAPNERWGVFYYAGIMFAEPMVEALKKCGKDLTVENFVKAMESIKDFQGIGPKITYGPNQRQGANSIFIAKCISDTKAQKLTGWLTSDFDVNEILKQVK